MGQAPQVLVGIDDWNHAGLSSLQSDSPLDAVKATIYAFRQQKSKVCMQKWNKKRTIDPLGGP